MNMNRRKLFKGLAAIAAALSVPRLGLAADNPADIVLRELKIGLLAVKGQCFGHNVGVDTKHLRACFSNGRLHIMTWRLRYGGWLLLRNIQVFDFDEFKRLQRGSNYDRRPEGAGWKPLDTWLREARGLNFNQRLSNG